jgi:hypothetical protein
MKLRATGMEEKVSVSGGATNGPSRGCHGWLAGTVPRRGPGPSLGRSCCKKEYRPKRVIDPITPATWLAYSGRNT